MVLNGNNENELARIWKEDILTSLHCALPGIVESFDTDTQTACVRPAVKRRHADMVFALPLLRDVPVFFPGSRTAGITWPVSPGDECLVVFADSAVDRWFASGEAEEPGSGRSHDLSDAFAFVGFRSRPNALADVPEEPSFFGGSFLTEEAAETLLAGKADAVHTHAAGDITSGTLALARGGSGRGSTGSTTVIDEIAAAASGCEVTAAQYAWWGKVAMVRLVVKKTAAVSSGTTTLCTLVSGKRPKYNAMGAWAWNKTAQIATGGAVQVNGAITANSSLTILATYVLA